MAKKKQVFDDGYIETEDILEDIEKAVAREYKKAHREITEKLNDYLRQFREEDEKQKALLDAGKITEKDYQDWRYRHICIGKRWDDMRKTLAEDYYKADVIAKQAISKELPSVYAVNYNFATYQIMKTGQLRYSFTLYNHSTVERLLTKNPKMLPDPGKKTASKIARGEAVRWNEKQIQSSITQSILQGESIAKAALRLEAVTEKGFNAAMRNARTAITGAQNAGRQDSYRHAEDLGIKLKRRWIATLDDRTRHEHRELHGQVVEIDEPFVVDGEEIMFPGDPSAEPSLVYNCRCATESVVAGFEGDLVTHSDKMQDMTYEEWKEGGF